MLMCGRGVLCNEVGKGDRLCMVLVGGGGMVLEGIEGRGLD